MLEVDTRVNILAHNRDECRRHYFSYAAETGTIIAIDDTGHPQCYYVKANTGEIQWCTEEEVEALE